MTKGTESPRGLMLIRQKGMLRSDLEMIKRTSTVKNTNEDGMVDIEEA